MKFKANFFLAAIIFLAGCTSGKKEKEPTTRNPEIEDVDAPLTVKEKAQAKNVTERDYSITKEIAYNDMFLDSLSMEKYISDRQLGDKKLRCASGVFTMPEIINMPGLLKTG